MTTHVQGIALIVVNVEFNNKRLNRKDAFADLANSKFIWGDVFNFQVESALSLTRDAFQRKLNDVKTECINKKLPHLVVVISSHGQEKNVDGMWRHHIRFKDGLILTQEAVIDALRDSQLKDVNKFIIIEACRNRPRPKPVLNGYSEVDGVLINPVPNPGEDKGAFIHIEGDGQVTDLQEGDLQDDDVVEEDADPHDEPDAAGDRETSAPSSTPCSTPFMEELSISRAVIMFGSASQRIAYRGQQRSSWLIRGWYEEVKERRAHLSEAIGKGVTGEELADKQFVSFMDMATRVSFRISKLESKNQNKAVGCMIHRLLEDVKLQLFTKTESPKQ